jgi:hypothetical protein
MRTDIEIEPITIPFRYPWSDESEDVRGLVIRRIAPHDSKPTLVDLMDENTPKPETPEVKCISVLWNRIDDFRFLETSTWIPMI